MGIGAMHSASGFLCNSTVTPKREQRESDDVADQGDERSCVHARLRSGKFSLVHLLPI